VRYTNLQLRQAYNDGLNIAGAAARFVPPSAVKFRRSRFAGMFLNEPLKTRHPKVLGECVTADLLGDPQPGRLSY